MRLSMLNRCNCRNEKTGVAKVNATSNVGKKVIELSKLFTGDKASMMLAKKTYCYTTGYNQANCRFILGVSPRSA